MSNNCWWHKSVDDICNILNSDTNKGLKINLIKKRQAEKTNEIDTDLKISPWSIFFNQFTDTMVLVLLGATVLSGLIGAMADAITIMAIVFLNAILGFIQEYKAEKSLEEINKLAAPYTLVIREGKQIEIPSQELVIGDLVLLQAGDKLPADIRIIDSAGLLIEEAALTGESLAVEKSTQVLNENIPLAERSNMAYMGTVISKGRGKGLVIATGMETEMGKIAGLIQQNSKIMTPLQVKLAQLGNILIIICLVICVAVALLGIYRGEEILMMLMAGISLAVAAIPEGLPAIVTVVLALGVQRMAKRNAIIRKLPAVETLGSTTVICSDKTGTLTKNQLTVKKLATAEEIISIDGDGYKPQGNFTIAGEEINPLKNPVISLVMETAYQCNNAVLKKKGQVYSVQGDATEGALLVMAKKAHYLPSSERIKEIPFDSERKRMSVIIRNRGKYYLVVKGALDIIIQRCESYLSLQGKKYLDKVTYNNFLALQDEWGAEALRVLGFAYRPLEDEDWENLKDDDLEQNLTLLGICGMIDPPRDESPQAVAKCLQAGIIPIMITGDHPRTAGAIARQIGITAEQDVITGMEINDLNDTELCKQALSKRVFARVSPLDKNRIVTALQKKNHVVAMTGDGVNDAPAIKAADIGIAMGISGTQVSKEAAAMILMDDNFSTIIAAIYEGRAIYDNIRKFIRYLLGCNIGEVLLMFIASILGMPLPLLPIQILWVNLITDGLPAMALGIEPPEPGIMRRRPRPRNEGVFARGLGGIIFARGLYIAIISLLLFFIGIVYSEYHGNANLDLARSMALTTLVLAQLFYVFECRSEQYSPFELGFFKNKFLVLAVLISVFMQLLLLYNPFFQSIFNTVPLNLWQWFLVILFAGGQLLWKLLVTTGRRLLKYSYHYAKIT